MVTHLDLRILRSPRYSYSSHFAFVLYVCGHAAAFVVYVAFALRGLGCTHDCCSYARCTVTGWFTHYTVYVLRTFPVGYVWCRVTVAGYVATPLHVGLVTVTVTGWILRLVERCVPAGCVYSYIYIPTVYVYALCGAVDLPTAPVVTVCYGTLPVYWLDFAAQLPLVPDIYTRLRVPFARLHTR